MTKVNLSEKLAMIDDFWNPRIVGELNGQQVKLAKFQGEFDWHHHEREDEMFLVLEGKIVLHLRGESHELDPGEFFIVPRGVEHKPEGKPEASVLMFEPASTLNTGNQRTERTVENPRKI